MCGICGIFNKSGSAVEPQLISAMVATIKHRGPDSDGIYCAGPIGLGHARLAIIDLSANAHQPMSNQDGSIWITYNGEIFNHLELRKDLIEKGYKFKSSSDTETLLQLYAEYGESCLPMLKGFFAFVVWDARKRCLFSARDRLGVKPFFYCFSEGQFSFASEIKALLKLPFIKKSIDRAALSDYFTFLCIPSPRTIFADIKQLPPAHYLHMDDKDFEIKPYFRFRRTFVHTRVDEDEIHHLTEEAVKSRLMSDVPVGLLLSGGIDSTIVLSIAAKNSPKKIHTFSVGFQGAEAHFNELDHARRIANYFGTEHHEIMLTADVDATLPRTVQAFDQPFAGTSVPVYDICGFASEKVKVVLSGVGGDEAAAGYPRHLAALDYSYYEIIPKPIRSLVAKLSGKIAKSGNPYNTRNRILKFLRAGEKSLKEAYLDWLAYSSRDDVARLVGLEHYDGRSSLMRDIFDKDKDSIDDIFFADLSHYLPSDLLAYSDRLSMAHGLELREPLCDHEYLQYFLNIPLAKKIHNRELKYLYKKIFKDDVPRGVMTRRKQGFSMPVESWLADKRLANLLRRASSPVFWKNMDEINSGLVTQYFMKFSGGDREHTYLVWSLLVYAVWHNIYMQEKSIERISEL